MTKTAQTNVTPSGVKFAVAWCHLWVYRFARMVSPFISAVTGCGFCVLHFAQPMTHCPAYIAALHDSSVAPLVGTGKVEVIEDGLTFADAQAHAQRLNTKGGQ